jgi:hypothetical protein
VFRYHRWNCELRKRAEYACSIMGLVSAIHPPVTLTMQSEGLVCTVSFAAGMRIG